MIICLLLLLPAASSDPPENNPGQIIVLHSVLLRVRFTWHSLLPENRWALTPPFHPYWHKPAVYLCCTIFGVTSTGRYPASCPVKPGLSSSEPFRLFSRDYLAWLRKCYSSTFFCTCKEISFITVHSVLSNVAKIHFRLPVAMEFRLVCLGILAYSCQNTSRDNGV